MKDTRLIEDKKNVVRNKQKSHARDKRRSSRAADNDKVLRDVVAVDAIVDGTAKKEENLDVAEDWMEEDDKGRVC